MQTIGYISDHMNKFLLRLLFCLSLTSVFSPGYSYAQQKDSVTTIVNGPEGAEEEEFNLFLAMILLVAVSIMAGSFIACLVLGMVILLAFMALISFGVLSASVVVGWYKRSFNSGFRTFVMLGCCIACAVTGMVGFLLVVKLFELDISTRTGLVAGGISGAIAGVFLGWTIYKITRFILKWAIQKLRAI
jgi:hypothetical protein